MRNTSFFEKLTGSLRLSDDDLKALHDDAEPTSPTPAVATAAVAATTGSAASLTDNNDDIIEEIVDEDYQVPDDAEVETIEEVIEDENLDHEEVEEYFEEVVDDEPATSAHIPAVHAAPEEPAPIHEIVPPPVVLAQHGDYPVFTFADEEARDESALPAPAHEHELAPKIQPVVSWQDEHETAEHRLVSPRSPLPIDMYELHHEIIIRTLVPGITPENLRVSITRDRVSIAGTRPAPDGIPENAYFEREVEWGEFSRMIELPTEVDVEHAEAVEKYGLLVIRLPKVDTRKSQELKIRSV